MYVKLDEENRIIEMLDEDIDNSDHDDEGKAWLHELFPVYVKNRDFVMETPMCSNRDFVVEDSIARFDPLPESIEQMKENERNESIPDRMDEADDALSAMYEIMLYEQDIIDSQDEALCALYETMIGGE